MLKQSESIKGNLPGTRRSMRWVVVLVAGLTLALGAAAFGQNTLDWDDPANFWDFVGESASPEVESISHLYSGVDGTTIDITVTLSADDGVDMTSEMDGDRDSLSDWLNEDDKHAGIFSLFTNNGADGNTFNMGMNEGDRDDVVITEFAFSANVSDVAFTLYDVDKTNWNGPLGFEVSNRGSGWIDTVTVTGYSGATPVMPVFQNIRTATASAPANPYDSEPDNTAYVGSSGNVLSGRWEVSEKDSNNANTPENNSWATNGIYGGNVGNVGIYFPSPIDRVELRHDNTWSVVGNDDRTLPDSYWGGHSMEFGIGDLSFVPPQPCMISFTNNAGADVPGYQEGADIYVTLEDVDLNTDPATKQTIVVTVQNLDNGDAEMITLTETGNSTGIFRNTTGLPTSTDPVSLGDGTLQLSSGDSLSVSNTDPEFGPCTDTATVLLEPVFTKAVDKSSAMPGETVTYSFEPRYPGNELLTDVMLVDTIPPVTTFDAVNQGGAYDAGSMQVSWDLGSNLAGSIGTVTTDPQIFALGGDNKANFWEYVIATDSWNVTPPAQTPGNVGAGGDLVTDETDIYAFAGNDSMTFWKYDVGGDSWSSLANAPGTVKEGGSLVYDGTYIYGLRGDASTDFWRYDIALNTWTAMASTPAAVKLGGSLEFDGTYIYALRGDGNTDFWRYDIAMNTWTAMASTPAAVQKGGDLTFDGTYIYALRGNGQKDFWRYDIGADSWSALTDILVNGDNGGSIVYARDGDSIYAAPGNGNKFYRYDISDDTWTEITSAPANIKLGGDLIAYGIPAQFGTEVTAGPSLVVDDGVTPDTITVTLTLTSSIALTGVTPPALTVTGTSGASATYVSGPVPAMDDISAGGSASFTYTYTASAGATPGDVKFTVPAFMAGDGDFATADTNTVLVTPVLTYSVTVDDPPGGIPPGLEIIKNTAFLSDGGGVIPPSPSNEVQTTVVGGVDQPGVIGSRVWLDEDGDGVQDAGEDGIANVTVLLLDELGNIIDSTVTDINGEYVFPNLLPEVLAGVYTVAVDASTLPSGLVQTYDEDGLASADMIEDILLAPGEEHLTADFGYNYTSTTDTDSPTAGTTGAIGDTVWLDADGDGVQDPGEAGIGGVTVNLFTDPDGDGIYSTPAGSTTTAPDGSYIFDGLAPDSYVVMVNASTLPAGYAQTGDPDGTLDGATSSPVALGPGDVWVNGDFGYQPGSGGSDIGDTIYIDSDADGTLDAGEPGVPGVTVNLLDVNGDVIATTVTDENGNYLFPDLPAGTYTVEVTDTRNVLSTLAGQMANTGDPDGGGDSSAEVTVDGIADNLDQDFGYVPQNHDPGDGLIGDTVFIDYDQDGVPDPGEGIEGVVVSADDGTTTVYAVTDENGNYYFGDLDPTKTYTIAVETATLPAGLTNTVDPDGGGDSTSSVDLSLDADKIDLDQDFGYRDLTSPNTIAGTIWEDTDADGVLDGGEPVIQGVTVALLDANGNIVSTATTDVTGEYQFLDLPDGTYTVDVLDDANLLSGYWHSEGPVPGADNNSQVDPYTVTVAGGQTDLTGDFGYYIVPGAVGNYVWEDLSGDGLQGGLEPGIGGVLVTLTITYPTGDVVTLQTLTDAMGAYSFDNLLLDEDYDGAGGTEPTFVVTATTPDGMLVTLTNVGGDDTIDSDDPVGGETAEPMQGFADNTNDFGYVDAPPTAVIGNYIWLDEDGDGLQDAGEDGIGGVTVELYDAAGVVLIATTTTDADGGYLFSDVPAGTYTVKVDTASLPAGLDNLTGDPDVTLDSEHVLTVAAGEEYMVADFGYNWVPAGDTTSPAPGTTGAIGDFLWIDADGDGEQDAGEAGIPGVTVNLYNDPDGDGVYDNLVATTTTDATGHYIFDGLAPDGYVVEVDAASLPAGYTQTGDPDGMLDNMTEPTPLGPGDVILLADFGYQPSSGSDIGDTIYFDTDADGTQDPGEKGIAGVTVTLEDAAGNPIATTTTDASGMYLFPSLPAGSYTVVITDTDNVLNDLVNTQDPDLGGDRQSSVSVNGVTNDLNQDFGFTPEDHDTGDGIIGDTIFHDRDGSGSPDPGEGLEGVTVELYDATGTVLLATTTTDENGNYYFGNLSATATYTVKVDTGSLPAGMTNTVDPDAGTANESVVDLSASGGINMNQDFGYRATTTPNTIAGTIWEDTDADGTLDEAGTGVEGVTVVLLDASGDIVGTTTTDMNGNYSFTDLPDGTYTVDVTDDANVLGGMWHSTGPSPGTDNNSQSDPYTVAVAGGTTNSTADFGYYVEPANIGNFVWFDIDGDGIQDGGEPGILGAVVTLTITYPNGDVVTMTAITDASGNYEFGGLLLDENYDGVGGGEPTYTVTVAAPPGGTASPSNVGGDDTIDSDDGVAGESAEITQGGSDPTNDFGFTGPKLAKMYADWVAVYGLTGPASDPAGNPDGDVHPNLEEYAFWLDPLSGIESGKAFCAAESLTVPGQIDAFFTRTAGLTDVTYTLEGIADLSTSPGGWTDITSITPTIVDNMDGSETVTYANLESDPLLSGGTGFVRMRVDLSSPVATVDTAVFGWEKTTTAVQCESYSNPFLTKPVFSGVVDSMTGSNLEVAGSVGSGDVKAAMDPMKTYFVEVVGIGDADEGHRFEVDYAASDANTIAINVSSTHNTQSPVPDLSGQTVVLQPFRTLGELFDIADFNATNDPNTADRLLFRDQGDGGLWRVIYALDDGVNPVIWNEDGTPVADEGGRLIDPCEGMFVHPRLAAENLLAVGGVRCNDFACPLLEGANLVGNGFPMDLSFADRDMEIAAGFFTGSADPANTDKTFFWLGDTTPLEEGYDGNFLFDVGAPDQFWVNFDDSTLTSQDAVKLFKSNRSALIDVTSDRLNYVMPMPWTK